MSIYGADSERSLEPPGEKLDLVTVTRSSGHHGLNAMSCPSQDPSLPSELWYNLGPPQPPPHAPPQPSLASELPFMLPGEQMAPGTYPPVSYGTHQKPMVHTPNSVVMFPHYIKQEPGVITEHVPQPPFSHPSFIKHEPGLHDSNTHTLSRPDLTNHNGSPHMSLDLGPCADSRHPGQVHTHHHHPPHHGQYAGRLPLPHTTLYGHTAHFIKQESGLSINDVQYHGRPGPGPNEGAPGPPLHIKQEPGLLRHVKQEPGTPHSFHGDPFYEHSVTPFPSKPINFNFMADIEDIVQPTNSGKLCISSLC